MEVWDDENDEDYKDNQKTKRNWYLINDRIIVRAFFEHFSKIWNSVDERNRDSTNIRAFFEPYLQNFKNQKAGRQ
jgi:hypothetical protein